MHCDWSSESRETIVTLSMNTRYRIIIVALTAVFEAAKKQFELSDILPEQWESIKGFFEGKDVLVNLPRATLKPGIRNRNPECMVPENIYTPPPMEDQGNSEGEGEFRPKNFRGVEGVHAAPFPEGEES